MTSLFHLPPIDAAPLSKSSSSSASSCHRPMARLEWLLKIAMLLQSRTAPLLTVPRSSRASRDCQKWRRFVSHEFSSTTHSKRGNKHSNIPEGDSFLFPVACFPVATTRTFSVLVWFVLCACLVRSLLLCLFASLLFWPNRESSASGSAASFSLFPLFASLFPVDRVSFQRVELFVSFLLFHGQSLLPHARNAAAARNAAGATQRNDDGCSIRARVLPLIAFTTAAALGLEFSH